MTYIASEHSTSFRGSATPAASTALAAFLNQYDWHYIVTIESPHPASADWLTRFGEAIDSSELFPHGCRYTSEPPGWVPMQYRNSNGDEVFSVLIAVPPGAYRCSVSAYEGARPVLENAARIAFINPKLTVRLATPMQIDNLLRSINQSTLKFTTAWVREHHETWNNDQLACRSH